MKTQFSCNCTHLITFFIWFYSYGKTHSVENIRREKYNGPAPNKRILSKRLLKMLWSKIQILVVIKKRYIHISSHRSHRIKQMKTIPQNCCDCDCWSLSFHFFFFSTFSNSFSHKRFMLMRPTRKDDQQRMPRHEWILRKFVSASNYYQTHKLIDDTNWNKCTGRSYFCLNRGSFQSTAHFFLFTFVFYGSVLLLLLKSLCQ